MTKEQHKKLLLEASNAYYNLSEPIMDDLEFDKLFDEYKEKYPNDDFLSLVGSPVTVTSWDKAEHKIPMCSLNKAVNTDDLREWANKYSLMEFCISEKLDGISLDLEYENGNLVKAITRGDGIIGEDIFNNVKKMENVKVKINNYTGSLRGEIILTQENFNKIVFEHNNPIKNLRNGASGLSKRYDGRFSEYLTVRYYDCSGNFKNKKDKFAYIEKFGLKTCYVTNSIDLFDIFELYENYENGIRASLNYEIDGLVIECDNLEEYDKLGIKDNRPKAAIALKFTSLSKETTIKDVVWQLGASGKVTPIALINPIKLGGAEIRRVSLHNYDMFSKHDLSKNDIVLVSRRNDVIPYLESVIDRVGTEKIKHPKNCPDCNSDLVINGKFLECQNKECKGLSLGILKKWISASEMQREGIGSKTIEKFYELNLVKTPADLYRLKKEDIRFLDGFGERSAEKIIENINSHNSLTLPKFISGLNIKNFGSRMAESLVEDGYDSLDKIRNLDLRNLKNIKGIEEKTAISLLDGLNERKNIIDDLLNVVTIKKEKEKEKNSIDGKLSNKSFCFTGKVEIVDENGERYTRGKLQQLVIKNGGELSDVKNGLTFLVQADVNSQSSKTKKANSLGIKIISDVEFLEMI